MGIISLDIFDLTLAAILIVLLAGLSLAMQLGLARSITPPIVSCFKVKHVRSFLRDLRFCHVNLQFVKLA